MSSGARNGKKINGLYEKVPARDGWHQTAPSNRRRERRDLANFTSTTIGTAVADTSISSGEMP
jgi:hypothetical protein